MPKSCYIHIPFCHNICSYCDFCKMYYNKEFVHKYLKSLDNEIKENYKGDKLNTLYIGGGTPSSLTQEELDILFNTIKTLKLNRKYEFTFECNVKDINEELLKKLKENKVNRLSIGVQSFNKCILDNIGRKEVPDINKILLAKKYFKNISLDLMYAANNETITLLNKDLDKYLSLDVNHISIYCLILEDNTILKINNYKEIDDDLSRKMYDNICKRLKENNYIHYEISNFAKKEYESKHNLTYWHNKEYYGFGLSASGFINNKRYENTRNLNKYINGSYLLEEHTLTKKEDMENEMILSLRTLKGINKNDFYKKYKRQIKDVFNVEKLSENKKYYYIKEDELFISNSILIDFIDIED